MVTALLLRNTVEPLYNGHYWEPTFLSLIAVGFPIHFWLVCNASAKVGSLSIVCVVWSAKSVHYTE